MDLLTCFFPLEVNRPLGIGIEDPMLLHSVLSTSSSHREGCVDIRGQWQNRPVYDKVDAGQVVERHQRHPEPRAGREYLATWKRPAWDDQCGNCESPRYQESR